MGDTRNRLGRLVDERMKARGWKQVDLARRSGVQQNYISNVIRGKIGIPTEAKAAPLRAALDLTRDEWYEAAGLIEPAPAEEEWTADVGEPDAVALVAGLPIDATGRAWLARQRARLSPEQFRQLCADLLALAAGVVSLTARLQDDGGRDQA